ncbi:uncharacterized protein LOC132748597 [Ruditapes philippinarum]|uniref:uncharacterized protein LOC132748597 n=1 Tax=Ruditapes philippinarum TaxID=129788 RepID=UPI00295AC4D6|nr:uncharacterized protein LOC132748597 [Ruditapes philippinarum]
MERLGLNLFAIFLIGTATVLKLSEASCERKSCATDADCTASGQVCLGPDGSKTCWHCGCRQRHECQLVGNQIKCDCSDSDGYNGTFCECRPPPISAGNDVWSIYNECEGELLDEYDVINGVKLLPGDRLTSPYANEMSYDGCVQKCAEFGCYAFTYGRSICRVYNQSYTTSNDHCFK